MGDSVKSFGANMLGQAQPDEQSASVPFDALGENVSPDDLKDLIKSGGVVDL